MALKVSELERDLIRVVADRHGQSVSAFLRETALVAVDAKINPNRTNQDASRETAASS